MKGVQRSTCFVCCRDFNTQPDLKRYVLKSTISKHLDVIFILKYIFELPSNQLSLYLQNCPNIDQWITICDTCDELIDSSKSIYRDLLKVEINFRATKQRIVDIVKGSYNECGGQHGDELDIMAECRRFISQHQYTGLSNPFAEGDAKAQNFVNQASISTAILQQIVPKEEVEEFQNFDDVSADALDDLDWEPNNFRSPKFKVRISGTKQKAGKKRKLSSKKQKNSAKARKLKLKKSDSDNHTSSNKDDEFEAELESADNSEIEESSDEFEPKSKNKHYKKRGKRMIKKRKWDGTKYLISCPTCGKRLSKFKLPLHNRTHGPHQCDSCPNNFRSPTLLYAHRIEVHNSSEPKKNPDGSVTCTEPNCNITVASHKELERHFGTEHKEALQLTCTKCDAKFYTRSRYLTHQAVHFPKLTTPGKSFTCEHCGAAFSRNKALNFHQLNTLSCKLLYQTEAEATTVCDQCGVRLGSRAGLLKHIKQVHSEEALAWKRDNPKFSCSQCGDKFEARCQEPGCEKVFQVKQRLQDHMFQHKGEPQYECDVCKKMFYYPDNLKVHKMSVHTNEKVKCDICMKEYTSMVYLKRRHRCELHIVT